MNWKIYLYNSQDIAIALNCAVSTVETWKAKNEVPAVRFKQLVPVLAELGYELTPTQMRALNDGTHNKI